MENKRSRYYLVAEEALPETLLRVTKVQELLTTGQAQTIGEASEKVGISRSAYYKYKNAVLPFQNVSGSHMATFQLLLLHKMGVLSSVLRIFAETGTNILTINQGIPANGAASVSITADTTGLAASAESLLNRLDSLDGVISAAVVAV